MTVEGWMATSFNVITSTDNAYPNWWEIWETLDNTHWSCIPPNIWKYNAKMIEHDATIN